MNHEHDEALDAAYRRASEAEAGEPPARVRATILAEAAAAARRREPAANAPRYWMRAAAGVAVIGVGVLLWRQTDHALPGDGPVAVMQPVIEAPAVTANAEVADDSAVAEVIVPPRAPLPAASPPSTAQAPPSRPPANAPRAQPLPPPAPASPPPPPAMAPADAAAPPRMLAAQAAAERRAESPAAESERNAMQGASREAAARAAERSPIRLLQRHFPELQQSSVPRSVWLVMGAGGERVAGGEVPSGTSLDDALVPVMQSMEIPRSQWVISRVLNAHGQPVDMAIAELR